MRDDGAITSRSYLLKEALSPTSFAASFFHVKRGLVVARLQMFHSATSVKSKELEDADWQVPTMILPVNPPP
jgi:hypothetical protein